MVYFQIQGLSLLTLDNHQGTALHWAAYYGSDNTIDFLFAWNVPLDYQDDKGETALHLAVQSGHSLIVKKLVQKGANKLIRNKEGKLPADIAKENNFDYILQMLEEKQPFLENYYGLRPGMKKIKRTKN